MLHRLQRYFSGRSSDPLPVEAVGPRDYIGGLWHEMGEMQFKFLVERGLLPEHTLLDIACGSLRLGVRVIPYLNAGNYLGIDMQQDLIEHGKIVEIGSTLCLTKQPELVVSGSFEFTKFSKRPDVAITQSLFSHLIGSDIALCLGNLSGHRKDSTIFYATFFEVEEPVPNPAKSHPHVAFRFTREEMRQFGSSTGWKMDYIGEWNHPRGQKMLRYTVS